MVSLESPESECSVEEVVENLHLPGVEVGTVGEGLDAEENVAL